MSFYKHQYLGKSAARSFPPTAGSGSAQLQVEMPVQNQMLLLNAVLWLNLHGADVAFHEPTRWPQQWQSTSFKALIRHSRDSCGAVLCSGTAKQQEMQLASSLHPNHSNEVPNTTRPDQHRTGQTCVPITMSRQWPCASLVWRKTEGDFRSTEIFSVQDTLQLQCLGQVRTTLQGN